MDCNHWNSLVGKEINAMMKSTAREANSKETPKVPEQTMEKSSKTILQSQLLYSYWV